MPPIALQLYSLRERLFENFQSVIREVAAIGFVGVETFGMYAGSPESDAALFQELDLQVTSAHVPLPLLEKLDTAIADARVLGVKRVVCAWYPPERFTSRDDIRRVCDELNTANQTLRANGLELHYHNHWQECGQVDGKLVYRHMLDLLEPTIGWEVDVYWAKVAGLNPADMVRDMGARAPLLHIKDGPGTMDGDMTAVGEGVVNMGEIADAGKHTAEWWIVELDRCATDMMTAVRQSYAYLTERGLAYGK